MASALQLRLGAPYGFSISPTFSNFLLDQTTDAAEWVFMAPEAITITRLGFRYGVRTGTPPTFKISLQGVDTSGNPDGTIKGGGSPASKTFTPPADTTWNSTWQWQTLDNSYTCTRSEDLSIVIARDSGTIDASNNSSFSNQLQSSAQLQPYAISNNAGARTRSTFIPIFGYASAGTAYGNVMSTIDQVDYGNSSTPDEYALAFTVPSTWFSTFKLRGIRHAFWQRAGSSLIYQVYSGTTVLQTKTQDADFDAAATSDGWRDIYFADATLATLTAGTQYRVGIQANSPPNASRSKSLVVASAADLDAWQGGQAFFQSTRSDAGAWTDDTVRRPLIDLIFDDITAPSGSGGPVGSGRLTGGLQ